MKQGRYLLPLVMFLVLAAFILYLTITVLLRSGVSDDQVSLASYFEVFTNPHLQRLVSNSVLVSVSSAVISTLLGLIISLAVYKTELPGRRIFWFAVVLPMVFPGFVKSLSYTFLQALTSHAEG